jgi:hypothetical protein
LSDAAASRSPKTKSLTVDTAPVPPVAQDLGEQVPVLARPLAVDRVVGGHDARDALGRHALEVRQVYLVQRSLLDGHVDPEPGVLHRVERIVLGAGHNVPLRPAGQGRAKRAQVQRVVSVGLLHPAPGGVTWQVDARPAEEVPALGPDLGADGLADPLLQRRIPGGALGHRHGKRGPFARDAAARAVHEADPGLPRRATSPWTYGRAPYRAARMAASPAQNRTSPSSRPSRSVSVSCSYRLLACWTGSAPARTAATAAPKADPARTEASSLIGSRDRARRLERGDAVPVQAEIEQDIPGLRGEPGRRAEPRRGHVELDRAGHQLELASGQEVLVGADLRVAAGLEGVLHRGPRPARVVNRSAHSARVRPTMISVSSATASAVCAASCPAVTMARVLRSRNSSSPATPIFRPMPDCWYPPNGASGRRGCRR